MILVFSGQVFSLAVHETSGLSKASQPDTNLSTSIPGHSSCHDTEAENATTTSMDQSSGTSCCEGDCTMSGCHSSAGMVGFLIVADIKRVSASVSSPAVVQSIKRSTFLFRPPILA